MRLYMQRVLQAERKWNRSVGISTELMSTMDQAEWQLIGESEEMVNIETEEMKRSVKKNSVPQAASMSTAISIVKTIASLLRQTVVSDFRSEVQ
jgi:cytidylate kinase